MPQMARLAGHRDGVPIYSYPNELSTPPVSVIRLDRCALPAPGAHIHDFPVLVVHGDADLIDVVAAGATVDPSLLDDRVGALALFSTRLSSTTAPAPRGRRGEHTRCCPHSFTATTPVFSGSRCPQRVGDSGWPRSPR